MAFKGRASNREIDYDRLKTSLTNSGLQTKSNALYQTIFKLIDGSQFFRDSLLDKISKGDKISLESQIEGNLSFKNGGVLSGLYTPFVILINNLSGVGVDDLFFYRSGDLVTVFGRFQVTPTAIGVNTEFAFELPIISYFTFDYQCAGSAYSPTVNQGAAIIADVGNNRARMQFLSVDNSTFDLSFTFGYKVFQQ